MKKFSPRNLISDFVPLVQIRVDTVTVSLCDRCVGQNNKWPVLNLYAHLVHSRFFTEINQKFLCSGHSFLPCYRNFALIERKKEKSKALIPGDFKYIIAGARIKKPFTVIEMQESD